MFNSNLRFSISFLLFSWIFLCRERFSFFSFSWPISFLVALLVVSGFSCLSLLFIFFYKFPPQNYAWSDQLMKDNQSHEVKRLAPRKLTFVIHTLEGMTRYLSPDRKRVIKVDGILPFSSHFTFLNNQKCLF